MSRASTRAALAVFRKEIVDALRDRRTLLVVLVSSVLLGPLALVVMSGLIATLESHAERREVYLVGSEHAPTLVNYLQRQTYTVKPAPGDYESQLRKGRFGDPVLVLPRDFESALRRGDTPVVELVTDSANKRSEAGTGALQRLMAGFNREQATLTLVLRGVAPAVMEATKLEEHDLASTATRGTRITGMLPFFVLMAVLYGALNAALDSTAGERERGSLEPLLMNPVDRAALVLGKWAAVASVAMLIAVLSCFSFIPAQWWLRSDTLAALFQFGVREALLFLVVLLPFAAALSALLMAVAIRCKSFKEAQANSTVLVLAVSLLPLVSVFDLGGEAAWHLWLPALAQSTLMNRVLKGESFGFEQVVVPVLVCVLLTVAGIWFVARALRGAAAGRVA